MDANKIKEIETKLQAEINEGRKTGFNHFMSNPLTRAMISTLPPSENLEVILKAAYESGFNSGGALHSLQMIKLVMGKR